MCAVDPELAISWEGGRVNSLPWPLQFNCLLKTEFFLTAAYPNQQHSSLTSPSTSPHSACKVKNKLLIRDLLLSLLTGSLYCSLGIWEILGTWDDADVNILRVSAWERGEQKRGSLHWSIYSRTSALSHILSTAILLLKMTDKAGLQSLQSGLSRHCSSFKAFL